VNEEGRLVLIDDTALWVVERGEGYPLIVLHGGPGLDHHEFADYLDPLIEHGIQLVLVDLRACGRSEPCPSSTWTLQRHGQDVIMLARALHLDRYAVFGHSYGAFVALQNAVDYPGMAERTVISGGLASSRWLDRVEENLLSFEPESLRRQVAESWAAEPHVTTAEGFAALMRDQFPFHFADPLDPRIDDYLERTAGMRFSPDVIRHFATADYGGIELEDRLDDIRAPLLVLAGRHDRTCVVEGAESMAAQIPDARLEIFEQSGHMMFVEEHDRFLDVVADFVAPGWPSDDEPHV
jgi:pimeloyl-ACP methyl ester carboxylesterase